MTTLDVAILNATVVDGTGAKARVTDVGIAGDRIVKVGTVSDGARTVIDAFGKILAPGFIDIHGHSDYSLISDPFARSKIHQGVTTEVEGNCGYHAAPVFGDVAAERVRDMRLSQSLIVDWHDTPAYLARLRDARPSINYARQIGYNTLRSAVTADKAAALTGGERDKLRALVREELELGALGLSYGLAYAPACFSRTEELVDVAEEAAAKHAFISFHLRNEDNTLLESLDEALHIGRASGAKVHVGHLKTFRRPNWHKLDAALSRLDDARTAGMDLTVDRYPHTAMNTQLKFILPTWALEGGIDKTKARLVDKEARAKVIAELKTYDEEVREVLIALVSKAENKHLEGRFLDDIASSDGKEPWDVICDILAVEGDNAFATFFGMSRDNLDRIVALDYAMIASDASVQAVDKQMGGGAPHPRCFDTFPYFLAEWVFARKTFTLEEAVRKMTSLPARRAGIVDRGVVAEGAFADLVLIDPHGLKPDVSYEHPIRYPPGVETVIVNGEVTIRDGRHLEARAGRLLTR